MQITREALNLLMTLGGSRFSSQIYLEGKWLRNVRNLLVRALLYHPLLLLGMGDVTLSHGHKAGIIFRW